MSVMPDEPTREEREEKLPEDGSTPFRPPDDIMNEPTDEPERRHDAAILDDTHPATDANLQTEEIYQEGYSSAAEASEPNAGNAVTGYDPTADQRRAPDYDGRSTNNRNGRIEAMDYTDYIASVKDYDQSLNDSEAEDTLQLFTELIAINMDDAQRDEVASELPGRLQDIMLAVLPSSDTTVDDFVEQAMETQGISEGEAVSRLRAAWQALKDGLSERHISLIETSLPPKARDMLS